MQTNKGRRRAYALGTSALILIGALAGCTEDRGRPSATLPPTSDAPSSTTEAPDPPGATGFPLPEAARAYTPEAARVFLDYFVLVFNAAQAASDPEPLREITQPSCNCGDLIERIQGNADEGIRVVGGEIVLVAVGDPSADAMSTPITGFSMSFRATQQPAQALDASGSLIVDTPELALDGGIELAWRADALDWFVSLWGAEARE